MSPAPPPLTDLYGGFRESYLDYESLTRQVRGWAEAFPDLVRLESLARTPEGREVWLLTIGPDPERTRPAVWVDGNMHAVELAGSSVALAIAEDVLRLHVEEGGDAPTLPAAITRGAADVLFHVVPRISPDGAEVILKQGQYVRSVPRDSRPNREHPRWQGGDVDGDGEALAMRVRDPAGEYVESRAAPGLMLARRLEDEGPFYRVYPEGWIVNFDGHTVPEPDFLADNTPDLNRNFPFRWQPEPEQTGAGPYPGSEPESRAIVDFATAHPNLFAWLNLHTFGGVFIRPRGDTPDTAMDRGDLALYRQLADWAERLTGYPMVSGHDEFTYEPGRPLCGDLTDFAYHQRGCLAMVCELWDLFAELDIPRRTPFVDHYTHTTAEELERLAQWDRRENHGRVLRPWRPVRHPQLGPVEVGGWDARVGVSNPPVERLPAICVAQSAFWLRVAALAPRVEIVGVRVHGLGDDITRIALTVRNSGYLPTHIVNAARERDWNEPLHAIADPQGCSLVDPAQRRQRLGHLRGWGRGLGSGADTLFHRYSAGSGNTAVLGLTVLGSGRVLVRVGSCRVGWVERAIDVGEAASD